LAFDDDHHLTRIASALWSRAPVGRATVLVGAGFSPNAQPLRVSQPTMPGWTALVERMIGDLYAGDDEVAVHRRAQALTLAAATSSALRVAQEYEAEFGRDALERMITENVPDESFGPGAMHRMLLELPWADVLTTNWDTLLERAAHGIEDRVYRVVHTVADIPTASPPRIVKLHGSLPSIRPFIFTEDDFRTYPERFAAFVNLARQSTMETVLVLLGFSGDDPNFLYWSGWVRDQLGDHAPSIYLVGPLDLTPSRRKMLEKRRIQPVDLSRLPQYAVWPTETRRGLAVQWCLERLTASRPYRRTRWPSKRVFRGGTMELYVPTSDPTAPMAWPSGSGTDWTLEKVEAEILPALRHNRSLYPGWVVAPQRARDTLWHVISTTTYEVRRILPKLPQATALALAFEYNWIFETALLPLFDLTEPITELLGGVDRETLTTLERGQVVRLALGLLRLARESGDLHEFRAWEEWLESEASDPEDRSRLQYERCLWSRDSLDFDQLDADLTDWTLKGDPFWMVRKAALLGENDRVDEARTLSREALTAIRAGTDKDREDIASWSREAHALLLRATCLNYQATHWEETELQRDAFFDRLQVLGARGCRARDEVNWFDTEMSHAPPTIAPKSARVRGFDVGAVSNTENWSSQGAIITRRHALEALRFYDETGTPARISPMQSAALGFAGAAKWLHALNTERSIGALARTAGLQDKSAMDVVLSREAVADLDDQVALDWAERLLKGARSLRDRMDNPVTRNSSHERLSVLLEMLSRLMPRLPSLAPQAIDLALDLYDRGPQHVMEKPLGNVFRRAFQVLPADQAPAYVRRVMATPTPSSTNGYYFDPVEKAMAQKWKPFTDPDLAPIITRLIDEVRDPNKRYPATMRLQRLQDVDALDKAQEKAYAHALWDPAFVKDGLPHGTPIFPWAFALMPHPEGADPATVVKQRILNLESLDGEDAVGLVAGLAVGDPPAVSLDARELKVIVRLFAAKAAQRTPPKRDAILLFNSAKGLSFEFWKTFGTVVRLAMKFASTRALVSSYFKDDPALEAAIAVSSVAGHGLLDAARASDLLLGAWLGPEEATMPAAFGSMFWLKGATTQAPFPSAIWSVVGDAVVAQSDTSLLAALEFLRAAYSGHQALVPKDMDGRLERALDALLVSTSDPAKRSSLRVDPGIARLFGGRLVAAMQDAGRLGTSHWEAWRAAALAERVPEIGEALASTTEPNMEE